MKFGIRTPSLKRSISARTTGAAKRALKRAVIPGCGKKGMGWLHDPKKAAYNAVYHRTTVGVSDLLKSGGSSSHAAPSISFSESLQNTPSIDPVPQNTSDEPPTGNLWSNPDPDRKWYEKTWACILLLVLFCPIGIFLMYKYHPDWKKPLKITADVVSGLWFLFWMIGIISVASTKYPAQLQLTGNVQTIDLKEKVTLQVQTTPSDANTGTVQFVSDNAAVATFSRNDGSGTLTGTVTGVSEGSTEVYVTYNDSVVSNKIKVTVEDKAKKAALQKQADKVVSQINALGTVTLAGESNVQAAREGYDRLPDEAKTLVTNYDVLTAAEATIVNEKAQEQLKADAAAAQKTIASIGTVTLERESAISDARQQYDSLSDEGKKLVTNYAVLTAAETTLQGQKDAKAKQEAATKAAADKAAADKAAAEKAAAQKQQQTAASSNDVGTTAPAAAENGQTVYWTPHGKSYHFNRNCPTLSRSKTILSGTLAEAKATGKTDPCDKCAY